MSLQHTSDMCAIYVIVISVNLHALFHGLYAILLAFCEIKSMILPNVLIIIDSLAAIRYFRVLCRIIHSHLTLITKSPTYVSARTLDFSSNKRSSTLITSKSLTHTSRRYKNSSSILFLAITRDWFVSLLQFDKTNPAIS